MYIRGAQTLIATKIGVGCPVADNSIGSAVSERQMAENRYLPLTCDISLTTVITH